MPAKDIYHNVVKAGLIKDGWTITNDPLVLQYGAKDFFVDLGAEKLLAAEKSGKKIAVEIKSFLSNSPMNDLEKAVGQYIVYRDILEETESNRPLYLAVNHKAFKDVFSEPIGQLILKKNQLKLLIFNSQTQEITQWIS
ncbi:element excision factor XisH family protein [Nostoc sp. FACHB-110]|uniref:element excision factor XisH family protein n=1 Tax=Nostoc sp. FACHB-110 TaxID=2692834 RepID=UPI001688B272|nr:element excision factor XisH family protein [Nostoc sp. FACHB-110]MBD2440056.1 XisH family protein [Nostoc sp. FACHB-110]